MTLFIQLLIFGAFIFFGRCRFSGKNFPPRISQTFPGQLQSIARARGGSVLRRLIGFQQQGGFQWIVRRERFYHRFLKWLGIASEIQTNHPDFDHRLYFITDYPDQLSLILSSATFRENITKLFDHSAKLIFCTEDRIWCEVRKKYFDKPDAFFEPCWNILRELKQEAAKTSVEQTKDIKKYRPWAYAFFAIHIALLFTPLFALVFIFFDHLETIDLERFALVAVAFGIGLSILWIILIGKVFYKTSWVSWLMADFLIFGCAGMLMCSSFLVRELNASFDTMPPKIVNQPIAYKECKLRCRGFKKEHFISLTPEECLINNRQDTMNHYKALFSTCLSNTQTYFIYNVYTYHWRTDFKKKYKIAVQEVIYDLAASGDIVKIPVHPGAFGIEWVDDQHFEYIKQ